jgi:4-hydroxyphenylacetate 3-monooxygenase
MWNARGSGALDRMIALAEACMADYDENGWTGDTWLDPDDVGYGAIRRARAAE